MSSKSEKEILEGESGSTENPTTSTTTSTTKAKKPKTKGKRKHDEDDDYDEESETSLTTSTTTKPKTKKQIAAEEKEKKKAHALENKAKQAKKTSKKPYTDEETLIARNPSMHRNAAIVRFMQGVIDKYVDEREWIKVASSRKGKNSIEALKEPIIVPRDLAVLEGVGKGTIEKITKFLLEEYVPPVEGEEEEEETEGNETTTLSSSSSSSGTKIVKNPDDEWIKDSDRDIILDLVRKNELTLDKVRIWRQDIDTHDL